MKNGLEARPSLIAPKSFALHNATYNLIKTTRKRLIVTYSWHDDALNIGENGIPVFTELGSLLWNESADVTRLDVRENTSLPDVLQVIGDVIHHLLAYKWNDLLLLCIESIDFYFWKESRGQFRFDVLIELADL